MTLLVLALLGLMVLVVTVSPPEQGGRKGAQTGTTTPQASSQELLSDPDAFDVQETLTTDGDAKPKTIEAELGDRVQIVVNGLRARRVSSSGSSVSRSSKQGVPARFELLAETPGTYPLVDWRTTGG